MKKKLKDLLDKYGPVAIVLYFVIFFGVWAGFAVAISLGFEPESSAGGAGVIGASYLATKLTQPLRIGATLVLTPGVSSLWTRLSGRPAKTPPPEAE